MFAEKTESTKYEVKLKLEVEDNDGGKEHFSKLVSLPFPPYIGLQILLESCTSGNPTDPIKTVMWNEFSEIFVCSVEWRYLPNTYADDHFLSIESHVAIAKSDGWERE